MTPEMYAELLSYIKVLSDAVDLSMYVQTASIFFSCFCLIGFCVFFIFRGGGGSSAGGAL